MAIDGKSYTRDVSPDMMNALREGVFKPFVDFVREQDDLALCFRGNSDKVTIYKHNHMIWDLYFEACKPVAAINLDLARFMEDWTTDITQRLMSELGFRGPDKSKTYDQLYQEKRLVDRTPQKSRNDDYEYHAIKLTYELTGDYEYDKKRVYESYFMLNKALESFLTTKTPTNYIKKEYFRGEKCNEKFSSRAQPKIEKRAQQDLFVHNHEFASGLFIYDLEFHQPNIGEPVPKGNEPDMLGIHFGENGEMISLCLIEVKSTPGALKGTSGVKQHLESMEVYIAQKKRNGEFLMHDRKREAYRIFNQYRDLKLYGLENKEEYSEADFLKLKDEIVFVFTNGLSLDDSIKIVSEHGERNTTIRDYLSGQKYNVIDYNIGFGKDVQKYEAMNRLFE